MLREPRVVPTEALREDDLPPPNADWPTLAAFALTFDGYAHRGSFQGCADLANSPRRPEETLDELRTRLFFEQRRWRHFMKDPDETCMEYLHKIVEEIRSRLASHGNDLGGT